MIRNMMKAAKDKTKAFTLAEVLTTLVILGVVAAITVSVTLRKVSERENKTRVRKAIASYQTLIEKMAIDNGIKGLNQLRNFANSDGNCTNVRRYFNIQSEGPNPCVFRTNDKLWYNVTDVTQTIIGFDDHGQPTNVTDDGNMASSTENKAFMLVTSFDKNGSIRVHDKKFEENENTPDNEVLGFHQKDGPKKWATNKIECFLDPKYGDLNPNSCTRDTSICVGSGNNQRCINRRTSNNAGECKIQMGWVLRINGKGSGALRVLPAECDISEFKDSGDNVTGAMVCGKDQNSNQNGCIIGNGYGCEVTGANEIQCHINGGEVSDISYNMKGEVTGVQCNSWNASCNNAKKPGTTMPSPTTCKTACCSYNASTNTWDNSTCGSDEEHVLWSKAVCELIQMEGHDVTDDCKDLMGDK